VSDVLAEPARALARRGLRATRQRIAILALLRRDRGHPSALEIHCRLLRRHPTLSLKTVYEVLGALVRVDLASEVTHAGAPARFEAQREPHHHARCRECGRLFDVPPSVAPPIRGRAALPGGFRVEAIRLTLEGRCLRCRDDIRRSRRRAR
jgi:Fe2+ or Zn2+ uptake regulation protein